MDTTSVPDFVPDNSAAERVQESMNKLESRRAQIFPELTPSECARLQRFGSARHYEDGDAIFVAGGKNPGMLVILSGHVRISQCDGMGNSTKIVDHGPGQFTAEVGQLSGAPALANAHAVGAVDALLIPPEAWRALVIA